MDDQTEVAEVRPAGDKGREDSKPEPNDRTYIARLDFLTLMHLLRWEVSAASVVTTSLGEEQVRIGNVPISVLEQINVLLRRHHETTTVENSHLATVGCEE